MDNFIKLKLIRTENSLKQEHVADALGISRSTYCSYEIGRRKIGAQKLEALAKFYRMPISAFFNTDVKTVNDGEHYDEKPMYLSSLSKDERELIVRYRILNDNKKTEAINAINQIKNDGEEK